MRKRVLVSIIAIVTIVLIVLGGWLLFESISEYNKSKESVKQTESDEFTDEVELDVTFISLESSWNMAMSSMISDFEEENPDIEINYKVYSESGLYDDTINKLYARGELGDVVEIITPAIYAENDVLYPIPDSIADKTDAVSVYKGETYGVGTVGYTTGVIYNKRMFEKFGLEEPETYEDFLNICQTLKDHGITPMIAGGANDWHLSFLLNHFLRTDILERKADWLSDLRLGKVSWTDSEPVAMLTDMTDLFNSGYIDSLWETIPDGSIASMMADESVAMVYSGGWMISDIQNISKNVDIGWFFLPDEDGNIAVEQQVGGYWTLTQECGEDSEKLEAATKFLNYFYSTDVYATMCSSVTGIPILKTPVEPDYSTVQQDIWDKFADADVKYSEDLSSTFIPQEFRKYLYQTLKDTLRQDITPEDAAQSIENEWDETWEETADED